LRILFVGDVVGRAGRAAIAEYLKSLPPVEGPPRPKKAKDAEKS